MGEGWDMCAKGFHCSLGLRVSLSCEWSLQLSEVEATCLIDLCLHLQERKRHVGEGRITTS